MSKIRLELIHTQKAEDCKPFYRFRSLNWGIILAFFGCIGFWVAVFEIVKSFAQKIQ